MAIQPSLAQTVSASPNKGAAGGKRAPRLYVTKAEMESCSSYMRGRLTVDKVNAAIDELAGARMQFDLMALSDSISHTLHRSSAGHNHTHAWREHCAARDLCQMRLGQHARGRAAIGSGSSQSNVQRAAGFADDNFKMMATYRKKAGALSAAERDRAFEIARVIDANSGMKKSFWVVENDLKRGVAIKMDNTGKSIMQLLRHLKRFNEVLYPALSHMQMTAPMA